MTNEKTSLIHKKIFIILQRLHNLIFFEIPFFSILIFGLIYAQKSFSKSLPSESYQILFTIIALSASISSILFQASPTASKKKRVVFCRSGERLLHSTLLFAIAIAMKFLESQIFDIFFQIKHLSNFMEFTFSFLGVIFVSYGLFYAYEALMELNVYLFRNHEVPRVRIKL